MQHSETIFQILNAVTLVAWIVILLAVRLKNAPLLRAPMIWALVLGFIYLYLLATEFRGSDFSLMGSLFGVVHLFSFPAKALTGWVHYLAFDLLIGIWMARDSATRKLPGTLVSICLMLTFFAGPIGALLYAGGAALSSRRT